MATGTASKKTQGKGAGRAPNTTQAQQRKPKARPEGSARSTGIDPLREVPLITGEPIELRLEDVEEDPQQPRQTFGEAAMHELAESIATHGVKVPISVHRHPKIEGRYIINDGARRYRASLRAGKATVSAVVTDPFSLVEQIVVNKVRDDTPPRDKALAFTRLMTTKGWTQRELAQASGLSEAYVSQHLVLLNLPAAVSQVFDSGRCADVTVINELVKAHKKNPDEVAAWLENDDQEITRGSVKLLRSYLNNKGPRGQDAVEEDDGDDDTGRDDAVTRTRGKGSMPDETTGRPRSADRIGKPLILGSYERRAVRLIPNRRWSAEGLAWVRYEDTGEEAEIELDRLRLKRLVEG
jgi:ParB family chromosome partitioning protein